MAADRDRRSLVGLSSSEHRNQFCEWNDRMDRPSRHSLPGMIRSIFWGGIAAAAMRREPVLFSSWPEEAGSTPPGYERGPAGEGHVASGCATYSCRKIRSLIAANAGWDSVSGPITETGPALRYRKSLAASTGRLNPKYWCIAAECSFQSRSPFDANASHLASLAWASVTPTGTARGPQFGGQSRLGVFLRRISVKYKAGMSVGNPIAALPR
jgi:hypothetical protein